MCLTFCIARTINLSIFFRIWHLIFTQNLNTMNSKQTQLQAFERLLNIMDDLREKCPWDKKQTLQTLRHLTIEETYELGDAILDNNLPEIKKELGDLFDFDSVHGCKRGEIGFDLGNDLLVVLLNLRTLDQICRRGVLWSLTLATLAANRAPRHAANGPLSARRHPHCVAAVSWRDVQ